MSELHIDSRTGDVRFPNGESLSPDVTLDEFCASQTGGKARSQDYGTSSYFHYRFTAGTIDGKPLLANACFYGDMLISLDLTVNLYPEGATDWSTYSLDVELATKRFHESLLRPILGEPTKPTLENELLYPDPKNELGSPQAWLFDWGRVYSSHDSKGGGTSIIVTYGNRREDAHQDYMQRRR